MNVHIGYKVRKTPDIEKEVQHQVERLHKRLQVFRPELIHLKGMVEQNSPREGAVVSLNLRLPSGQMAAQKKAPVPSTALKSAFDDLLQQINRHKDMLRSAHKWPRQRRVADDARPKYEIPFEDTIASVQPPAVSPEDIRAYVNINLGRLERFVERELYFRESAELMGADTVSKEEVVDEAILRALGDGEKPERLALEPWLYRLALRAMDEMIARADENNHSIHLEESARKRNVRASDESELQFHQPDESITEETIIADQRVSTPEQIASSDEMLRLVETALRGTTRSAREAFILFAIEGFTPDEIAAITDRKLEEVHAAVTLAQQHLRKSAIFSASSKQALFARSGTA
jgi:RNA polymerase sigma factor (sigma-70 family)